MKTYALFSGRHDLPENLGAICSKFDFDTFSVEKTPLWDEAINSILEGDVKLYVTGLTPVLVAFLKEIKYRYTLPMDDLEVDNSCAMYLYNNKKVIGKLILCHYNTATKQYVEQIY